ncbi:MAG: knotted carbamoyltransferase YgeW [Oscillospiraceae bacterium]|nr:knotted carbamoyltransferase YgeW [Oscillospiraceae bacterium]MBQ8788388.1 knotted carbamoyltransferase YgeW [Oscillospiraceae bacterium]
MDFCDAINKLPDSKENGLYGKSLLRTWDMSDDDIKAIARGTCALKSLRDNNVSPKIFDSGIAVSMFSKKDMGMEIAFASGCDLLGLTIIDMDRKLGNNNIKETATMASYMADALGVCESDFIEKSSRYIRRISDSVEEAQKNGVVAQKPCVINLGSDEDSPVQSIADFQYMAEHFGGIEELKGKKIAVTWAYSPNGTRSLAVPQGILSLFTRFGMNVVLAAPEGMDLMPDVYERAEKNAERSGGTFVRTDSMEEAFSDADVVIPINWAPFTFLEKRTELSAANLGTYIDLLEHELRENNKEFINWEVTEELMEKTKDGKALLMHDIPADVTDISCIRGEMTAQVYNANLESLLKEAGNRPYVIAAMIILSKSEDPKAAFKTIAERATKRYF